MAKEMFDKIQEELDKIKTLLKNSQLTGKIPDIERDIMLSKLRNIYEFLILYHPDIVEEPAVSEKKKEVIKPEVTIKAEPEIQQDVKIPTETHTKKLPENEPQPKTEKTSLTSEQKVILAEKLGTKNSFLHDVLVKYANDNSYAKKFQNSPINNIFSAIGLNERFQFTKELFSNNADLYQETLDKINQAAGFNDAVKFIAENFNWDFDNQTVHKLLELIRRRHPNDLE